MSDNLQVLVAGAGPVGLTMAAELARHGVRARIVDKAPSRSDKSKALVLWSRTLELMGAMGCADAVIGAGLRVRRANIFAGERRIARVELDRVDSPHPYALFLPQSETERLLEAHLEALGGRVERRVELVGLAREEGGVEAELAHPDGSRERVRADWLVGCDGAHSAVRHRLGLPFMGETEQTDFMLADVFLDGRAVPPGEVSLFWHPSGVLAIFPVTAGRFRIIADLGPVRGASRPADPTLDDVQRILNERGPGGTVARDPVWLSAFRINERKLRDYRSGRVFLAGDAAHIHSPAGGQGMNTGIQDACGLAWRLGLVCRGRGRDGVLLDSYSSERSAVGDQVLRNAGRLTRLAILRNPLLQALRNEVAALVARRSAARQAFATMLSELEIAYPKSPLSRTAAGVSAAGGLAKPGWRAPDVPLVPLEGEPCGLHRLLRAGRFVLVGAGAAEPPALGARYGAVVMRARRRDGRGGDALTLVRPDGYVGLVATAGDRAAVEAYLEPLLAPAQA